MTAFPSGVTAAGIWARAFMSDDVALVVIRDDVVRLTVGGVDPDARRVDVPERRIERDLRRLARRDVDDPGLPADRVHVDLGVIGLKLHANVAHAADRPRDEGHRARLVLEEGQAVVLEPPTRSARRTRSKTRSRRALLATGETRRLGNAA